MENFFAVSDGFGRFARVGGKGSGGGKRLSAEKKKAVLDELKAGKGILEVAHAANVGATTVARIRVQNKVDLPAWKSRTVAALTALHTKVVDDLQETHHLVPHGQKSILLGVLTDKIRGLSEVDAAAVTHNHLHISHGDLNSLLTDNKTGNIQQNKGNPETFDSPLDTSAPGPAPIDVESNDTTTPGESRGGGG